jgi:hypothetical protein
MRRVKAKASVKTKIDVVIFISKDALVGNGKWPVAND